MWTGSKMIVWGGSPDPSSFFNTGGLYDPTGNFWLATSTAGAPTNRYYHTAVWTGSKMIVWGGFDGSNVNSGGQYDPAGDSWTTTTTIGAPPGRQFHTAVWTDAKMIVWGGSGNGGLVNTGGQWSLLSLYVKN